MEVLVRYSYLDLHGWAQDEKYKVCHVRKNVGNFYEAEIKFFNWQEPFSLNKIRRADPEEIKHIEKYAGVDFEIDKYHAKKSLSYNQWQEYIALVDNFSLAKKAKNYLQSDKIRLQLQKWQEFTSDQEYIEMTEKGCYWWHPAFSPYPCAFQNLSTKPVDSQALVALQATAVAVLR